MSELVNGHDFKSPAEYDFRSDTVTTPTPNMLAAMSESSVGDDVYGEDTTTTEFEQYVASLTGHEAGLFVSSGTMGNQLGLRGHLLQPPHAVLCDHRSHIRNYEAGGLASLSQAMIWPVVPRNGLYLTLEDVKAAAVLDDDVHSCPTRVISLENTLGGVIMPLEEIRRISKFARENGLKVHLDGARLWNAAAAGAASLRDYGREFDSISLCFSKGLGAPVGSMLVGSSTLIKKARHVRKAIGGGMRQIGPIVNAARVALEDNFPDGLVRTHVLAKRVEKELAELGIKPVLPVDTSMIFVDLDAAGLLNEWLVEEGDKAGVKLGSGGRIAIHHQISDKAVVALVAVFKAVVEKVAKGELVREADSKSQLRKGYGSIGQPGIQLDETLVY